MSAAASMAAGLSSCGMQTTSSLPVLTYSARVHDPLGEPGGDVVVAQRDAEQAHHVRDHDQQQ
ncbi:hypothetical protein AB0J43_59955, partial [Nonomuraea fuscirosea]